MARRLISTLPEEQTRHLSSGFCLRQESSAGSPSQSRLYFRSRSASLAALFAPRGICYNSVKFRFVRGSMAQCVIRSASPPAAWRRRFPRLVCPKAVISLRLGFLRGICETISR